MTNASMEWAKLRGREKVTKWANKCEKVIQTLTSTIFPAAALQELWMFFQFHRRSIYPSGCLGLLLIDCLLSSRFNNNEFVIFLCRRANEWKWVSEGKYFYSTSYIFIQMLYYIFSFIYKPVESADHVFRDDDDIYHFIYIFLCIH